MRFEEKVCEETRMPSIPVCEWMHFDEPVVEARSELDPRVCVVLNPINDVPQQLLHFLAHVLLGNSDGLVAASVLAGPPPNVLEHAAVEVADKRLRQKAPVFATHRKGPRVKDVALFGLVQLSLGRDVGGNQPVNLVWIQRRRARRVVKVNGHVGTLQMRESSLRFKSSASAFT